MQALMVDREDPKIFAEWKAKLVSAEKNMDEDQRLNADEIDYILEELYGYEKMRDEGRGIQVRVPAALPDPALNTNSLAILFCSRL